MITVGELLTAAKTRYPHLSLPHVRAILAASTLQSRTFLLTHPDYPITSQQSDSFWTDVEKMHQGMPLSRVLGRREFWGHTFALSPDTLDPRPDSETLIDAVLARYPQKDLPLSIVDLGTGSGCLLLTLLKEYHAAMGLGVDQSQGALTTAERNAQALGVEKRARFVQSDWWEAVVGTFDLIIANPPYVTDNDYKSLDPVVRHYDPVRALKGGPDGLAAYRRIIERAPAFLAPKGRLFFEIGWNQANAVSQLLTEGGLSVENILKDLAHHDRVIVAS